MRISDWSSDVCSSDLPAQARRAAGDLYALSNRRVAVAFAEQGRGVLRQPEVEVIVPADRLWQRAPAVDAAGRVVAGAGVEGSTRWVTSSEERRVGKECVSPCGSQWCPDH